MSLMEFFGMFKRFSVMLTWQDLPLNDRDWQTKANTRTTARRSCAETPIVVPQFPPEKQRLVMSS